MLSAGPPRPRLVVCASLLGALVAAASAAQTPSSLALSARWTVALPAPPSQRAAVAAGSLFVALRTGKIVALDVADGSVRWEIELAASGPLAAGDSTLIVAGDRFLVGIDAAAGTIQWRLPLDAAVSGLAAVLGERGYVPLSNGSLVVVRLADGQREAIEALGASPLNSPIVADGRLVVAAADGLVVGIDAAGGSVVWRARIGGAPTTMAASGRHLFVGSDDNFLYCLDAANGKRRWRWPSSADVVGVPVIDARRVYYLALDNQLRALDRGNGHQSWKRPLPIRPAYGPLPFGGWLLVAGQSAEVSAFQPATGKPAGSVTAPDELAGPPMAVPLDAGKTGLLLLTGTGQVQMLEPPPDEPGKATEKPAELPKPIKKAG